MGPGVAEGVIRGGGVGLEQFLQSDYGVFLHCNSVFFGSQCAEKVHYWVMGSHNSAASPPQRLNHLVQV
jgi:hypothetical protein